MSGPSLDDRTWWRRHVVTLAKLAIGGLIVWFVARNLTLEDQVELRGTGGEVLEGRNLEWDGQATLLLDDGTTAGPWGLKDKEEAPEVRRKGDRWRITRANGKDLEGTRVVLEGEVKLSTDEGDSSYALSGIAWESGGEEDGWVEQRPALRDGLLTIFGRISLGSYLLALGSILCMYLCGIKRWQVLLRAQGIFVGFFEAMRLTFIGFFFNNVVPGLTGGDVVKAVMIARAHKGRGPDAVSTVIVDRAIGLLVLAAMAAVVLLFSFSRYPTIASWVFLSLAAATLGICLFMSRRIRKLFRIDRLLNLLPGSDALKRLDRAFLLYRTRRPEMIFCLAISAVSHVFNVLSVWFLGMDLGVDPDHGLQQPALLTYAVVVPIIMIVSAVPVLPGGWGVGEAAFGYFFRTVGIRNLSLAVGLSVLHRVSMLLWSLLGGVFLFLSRREAREAMHEARQLNGNERDSAAAGN